jgi:hypothetical protein
MSSFRTYFRIEMQVLGDIEDGGRLECPSKQSLNGKKLKNRFDLSLRARLSHPNPTKVSKMSNIHEIQHFLRIRVIELTSEVQAVVGQMEIDNKPNDRLMALIAEICDLEGQLEFVVAVANEVIDLTNNTEDEEVFVYEDDDDDELVLDIPVLRRQIAVTDHWNQDYKSVCDMDI